MRKVLTIIGFNLLVMNPVDVVAQDNGKSAIPLEKFYVERKSGGALRKIFTHFHASVSLGTGITFMSHKLGGGLGIAQLSGNQAPALFRNLAPPLALSTGYGNWVNTVTPRTFTTDPSSFSVSSDTAKIGFKSKALTIPLAIMLHYEFKRYRIGAGYSYEYIRLGEFHSISYQDKIKNFAVDKPGALMRKYFGMAGVSFYRLQDYLFTADLRIGNFKPKPNFNTGLITPSLYYNLGVTIERDFSEYLRAFIRPSFEMKNYNIGLDGSALKHNMNAFYVNFGFTYTLPELPRCFIEGCHAQINHAHGNKEYRSRRHPIYKKQNPGYGENYPKLIKYKGKNKNKLNPY